MRSGQLLACSCYVARVHASSRSPRRPALGLVAGAVHVVHGTRIKLWLGVTVCREVRWMLRDSFINLDELVGQRGRLAEPRAAPTWFSPHLVALAGAVPARALFGEVRPKA